MSSYCSGTDRVVIGSIWFLRMYVAMDRKPENGAEIQNSACGRSGIMMRLGIFKYAKNEEDQQNDEDNLPRGKKVPKEHVMPWANTDRIVFSDSYFASVPAAKELWKYESAKRSCPC